MGMYDSVRFKCPECGGEVEAQSKAGECVLGDFPPDHVPAVIAADVIGDSVYCGTCHTLYTVRGHMPGFVELWLE